jgi:hypothetical protein
VYVTTCSETSHSDGPKDCPRLRTAYGKRGNLTVKNFVIVTPVHLGVTKEQLGVQPSSLVTPRNWAIHDPKDMEICGDLDPPTC